MDDSEFTLCMFCNEPIDLTAPKNSPEGGTREHFVPKCLWERKHRPNFDLLPAHYRCNNAWSQDNEYFRDVLVSTAGVEQTEAGRRVLRGALRRKLAKRFGSVRKNLGPIRWGEAYSPFGVYLGRKPYIHSDRKRIVGVLQNVLRGVWYISQKAPMPLDYLVACDPISEVDPAYLQAAVEKMTIRWQHFEGDGEVFVCRYVKTPNKFACVVWFYRCLGFFLEAVSPELFTENPPPSAESSTRPQPAPGSRAGL